MKNGFVLLLVKHSLWMTPNSWYDLERTNIDIGDRLLIEHTHFYNLKGWASDGPPSAFLRSAKKLYQAKTTLPSFSFSNRLIPYNRIMNMQSVTILRVTDKVTE